LQHGLPNGLFRCDTKVNSAKRFITDNSLFRMGGLLRQHPLGKGGI
jgi:hypothetical protein